MTETGEREPSVAKCPGQPRYSALHVSSDDPPENGVQSTLWVVLATISMGPRRRFKSIQAVWCHQRPPPPPHTAVFPLKCFDVACLCFVRRTSRHTHASTAVCLHSSTSHDGRQLATIVWSPRRSVASPQHVLAMHVPPLFCPATHARYV